MIEDSKDFALYRDEEPHAIDYQDYLKERKGKEKKKARV